MRPIRRGMTYLAALALILSANGAEAQVRWQIEPPALHAASDVAEGNIVAACLFGEATDSTVVLTGASRESGCVSLPEVAVVAVRGDESCALPLEVQRPLAAAGVPYILLYCPETGEWTPFERSARPAPDRPT